MDRDEFNNRRKIKEIGTTIEYRTKQPTINGWRRLRRFRDNDASGEIGTLQKHHKKLSFSHKKC